jgi:hypothetical protein
LITCKIASSMIATGWLKSSVPAACAKIVRVIGAGIEVGGLALGRGGQQRPGERAVASGYGCPL